MKSILLIALMVALVAPGLVQAEESALGERLQILAPLVGERWLGHFRNDPEAPELIFSWEVILDGHGVRGLRLVPERGFVGESTFYWDEKDQAVAYLSLTNNGYVSRGTVFAEGDRIVVAGSQTGPNGTGEVRAMFWIDQEGRLNNQLHNLEEGEWRPAHATLFERE